MLDLLTKKEKTVEICSQHEDTYFEVDGYEQHYDSEMDHISCTCVGYKFGRTCSHVRKARLQLCNWHKQHGEKQTTPGECPRCGKHTIKVLDASQ